MWLWKTWSKAIETPCERKKISKVTYKPEEIQLVRFMANEKQIISTNWWGENGIKFCAVLAIQNKKISWSVTMVVLSKFYCNHISFHVTRVCRICWTLYVVFVALGLCSENEKKKETEQPHGRPNRWRKAILPQLRHHNGMIMHTILIVLRLSCVLGSVFHRFYMTISFDISMVIGRNCVVLKHPLRSNSEYQKFNIYQR